MIPGLPAPARVAVAMSGGVDSSVAAALLVEAGYQVVGLTMRLYDASGTSASVGGRCCGPRDQEDARQVAALLDIPFYVLDHADAFRAAVIDDFVSEYGAGRTPNPCVRCNERVKFSPLMTHARALGAQRLVTGHYARLEAGQLLRARDAGKDQSYFLFPMPAAALAYSWFPLGDLDKDTVRAHGRRLGLPNADKPDSQEICFVPDGDHAALVERQLAHTPGTLRGGDLVRLEDGALRVVGRHQGIHRFTIGQRRGLGVVAEQPLYVTAIDPASARVTVGTEAELGTRAMEVDDVRWLGDTPPAAGLDVQVQVRHRHTAQPARVTPAGRGARVEFVSPERAVAPGQAAVFYDGARVLGGGWIRGAVTAKETAWPA